MSMRARVIIAILVLSTAACQGPRSRAGAGFRVASGRAFVPHGVRAGTTSSVRYVEYGGAISRLFFKTLLGGLSGVGVTTTSKSYTHCDGGVCTTTTTYTSWVSDPAAHAAAIAFQKSVLDALPNSELPIETTIEAAARSLGGDTSGFSAQFLYMGRRRTIGPFEHTQFSAGVGLGRYTFHDRIRDVPMLGTGSPVLTSAELPAADYKHAFLTSPVRLRVGLLPFVSTWVQADLNWYVLSYVLFADEGEDRPASPIRFGVDGFVGPLRVGAEVAGDGVRRDGLTFAVEGRVEF